MPIFKIHRLRDYQQQHFRWAAHASGTTQIKAKDYHEAGSVEAETAYAAWLALQNTPEALRVGDVLEQQDGTLTICKYIGFEEARWFVPEPKPVAEVPAPAPETEAQGAEPSGPASAPAK